MLYDRFYITTTPICKINYQYLESPLSREEAAAETVVPCRTGVQCILDQTSRSTGQ